MFSTKLETRTLDKLSVIYLCSITKVLCRFENHTLVSHKYDGISKYSMAIVEGHSRFFCTAKNFMEYYYLYFVHQTMVVYMSCLIPYLVCHILEMSNQFQFCKYFFCLWHIFSIPIPHIKPGCQQIASPERTSVPPDKLLLATSFCLPKVSPSITDQWDNQYNIPSDNLIVDGWSTRSTCRTNNNI